MTNDKNEKVKVITRSLIVLSLIAGIISYLVAGMGPADAVFASFNLIKGSVSDAVEMNWGIRIIRWVSPISVIAGIITEVKPFFTFFRNRWMFLLTKDIIYSDSLNGQAFYESLGGKAVLCKSTAPFAREKKAKRLIIMMEKDSDNLEIYSRFRDDAPKSSADSNKKKSKKPAKEPQIFLCLNRMEPNLIPSKGNVTVFNIADLVAGSFWDNTLKMKSWKDEERTKTEASGELSAFWKKENPEMHITIVGYGNLGHRLLYKALLLNLFSLKQKIVYNIITSEKISREKITELKNCYENMNDDEVHSYKSISECAEETEKSGHNEIKDADVIIFSEETEPDVIQNLLYTTDTPLIYYYDPEGMNIEKILTDENKRLVGFGRQGDIFKKKKSDKENSGSKIFDNKLSENAKSFYEGNYLKLMLKHGDSGKKAKNWEKLPGYKKGLFINQLDFAKISIPRESSEEDRDELMTYLPELGHLQWCRYYFLNHYTFGQKKDHICRVHNHLIPFSKLDGNLKDLNRDIVGELIVFIRDSGL